MIVLRITQRRSFRISLVLLLARIRILQYPQPFGVRRHDSILDPVVHHLHKVAGAVGSAVQLALLTGATELLAPRRALKVPAPWC